MVYGSQLDPLFLHIIFSSEWEVKTDVVARRNVNAPKTESDPRGITPEIAGGRHFRLRENVWEREKSSRKSKR
jgi:hypothetical protein